MSLTVSEVKGMRVIDLRKELEKRSLDPHGVKASLQDRLLEALRAEDEKPDETLVKPVDGEKEGEASAKPVESSEEPVPEENSESVQVSDTKSVSVAEKVVQVESSEKPDVIDLSDVAEPKESPYQAFLAEIETRKERAQKFDTEFKMDPSDIKKLNKLRSAELARVKKQLNVRELSNEDREAKYQTFKDEIDAKKAEAAEKGEVYVPTEVEAFTLRTLRFPAPELTENPRKRKFSGTSRGGRGGRGRGGRGGRKFRGRGRGRGSGRY